MVRSIYQQPSAKEVHSQHERVVEQLQERFPQATVMPDEARADILAFTSFPMEHWKKIWSNNPQERLNKGDKTARGCGGDLPEPTSDATAG